MNSKVGGLGLHKELNQDHGGVELVITFAEKGADSDANYEPVALGRRRSEPPRK